MFDYGRPKFFGLELEKFKFEKCELRSPRSADLPVGLFEWTFRKIFWPKGIQPLTLLLFPIH